MVDGWRDRRRDGGVVLEVPDGDVIARAVDAAFAALATAAGSGCTIPAPASSAASTRPAGRFEPLTFCPGYLRGLAFVGDYAVVGLSRPRHDKTFGGLALDEELARRGADARCGLLIIDLQTGDVAHWLRVEGMVSELYDVVVLPGRPGRWRWASRRTRSSGSLPSVPTAPCEQSSSFAGPKGQSGRDGLERSDIPSLPL